jgi:hypothetical protein
MRIHIVVPDDTLARIDAERGDVSRSRWIVRAVETQLQTGLKQEIEQMPELLRRPLQQMAERAASPPGGCVDHPGAGVTENRGRFWCAAPGCTKPARI